MEKMLLIGILPVQYTYEDIQISGVIGKPEIARSNRSNQLFFVNKRYIKDKTLSAATEQAFKGLIPIGKFGFVILNIDINPSKVDVNVHPAKLEVRFEEENKIFQSIYHAIKDTLLKNELVANTERQDETEQNKSKGLFDFRKNETEKIENYNDEESKIKTNVINVGQGGPINTADVLEQLKKMQQDLEEQVEQNPEIKLNKTYIEMQQKENNENVKNIEENTEKEKNVENLEINEIKIAQNETEEQEKDKNKQNNIENIKTTQKEDNIEKIYITEDIEEKEKIEKLDRLDKQENVENSEKLQENPKEKLEEIKEQIQELEKIKYEDGVKVDFNEMYAKLFGTKPISNEVTKNVEETSKNRVDDLIKDNISVFETNEEYNKPAYKFIGIIFNTYIIIEMDKEMYILDQHATHERIMYEKVKKNYYNDVSKDSQMLLLPDIITLSHKEMEIARDNIDMFEKAGFSLEEFGENTIKLTGVPTVCIDIDNKELFLETLDEINTVARTAKQEKEEKFIATVACKAAVKANMVLTKEEVESLMDKLLELPNPFTCPHGRPTAIKMTKYDIERKFARK